MADKWEKIRCFWTCIMANNVMDFSFLNTTKKVFSSRFISTSEIGVFNPRSMAEHFRSCSTIRALKRVEKIYLEFFTYQTVFKNWFSLLQLLFDIIYFLLFLTRFDISKLNRLQSIILLFNQSNLAKIMNFFIILTIKNYSYMPLILWKDKKMQWSWWSHWKAICLYCFFKLDK